METRRIEIQAPHGLHMRVAAKVILKSRLFKARVCIRRGVSIAKVDSMLELLALGARQGTEVQIVAQGEDAKIAVQAVSEILMDGAGI